MLVIKYNNRDKRDFEFETLYKYNVLWLLNNCFNTIRTKPYDLCAFTEQGGSSVGNVDSLKMIWTKHKLNKMTLRLK